MAEQDKNVGLFKRLLLRVLPYLLPRKGRRAIYLATLFVEVSRQSHCDKELLAVINEKLGIVSQWDAMLFPLQIQEDIWGPRPLFIRGADHEFTVDELMGLAARTIRNVPEWSRYDAYEQVLTDTMEILIHCLKTPQNAS